MKKQLIPKQAKSVSKTRLGRTSGSSRNVDGSLQTSMGKNWEKNRETKGGSGAPPPPTPPALTRLYTL